MHCMQHDSHVTDRYLYVLAPNATAVEVFNLSGGVGKAKLVQTVDIAGPAKAAGVNVSEYRIFI